MFNRLIAHSNNTLTICTQAFGGGVIPSYVMVASLTKDKENNYIFNLNPAVESYYVINPDSSSTEQAAQIISRLTRSESNSTHMHAILNLFIDGELPENAQCIFSNEGMLPKQDTPTAAHGASPL